MSMDRYHYRAIADRAERLYDQAAALRDTLAAEHRNSDAHHLAGDSAAALWALWVSTDRRAKQEARNEEAS